MEQSLIIGKLGNQPFQICDPDVSRRHATLYFDKATGAISLEDSNSTNGTYIFDGKQFARLLPGRRVKVRPETMIRLGPETRFHIRRVLPADFNATGGKPKEEAPKPVNISSLRQISEQYIENKNRLDSKTATLNGLRGLSIVFTCLATTGSYLLADFLGLSNAQAGIISAVVLLVLVVSLQVIVSKKLKKNTLEKTENDRNYSIKYCCPCCHYSFKGKYYENIIASGKCPNCKVEFTE